MTRELVLMQIDEAIETAGKTTSRKIVDALQAAKQALSEAPAPAGVVGECVSELDRALALRCGVMDSDSKRERVEGERMQIVQSVVERLRAA